MTVRDICLMGVFTAIISVLSWISIPMPGIPATLQTFAVPLAGVILGPKKGALAVITYVLVGAVGVPVFAGFTGGFQTLFGASGGFIWGFPLMAICAGLGAKKGAVPAIVIGLIIGITIDYTFGMFQFMFVTGLSLRESFFAAVVPFILAEAVKAALAGIIGMKCRSALMKIGIVTA